MIKKNQVINTEIYLKKDKIKRDNMEEIDMKNEKYGSLQFFYYI